MYSDIKWVKWHPDEEQPQENVSLLVTDGKVIFIGQLWGITSYRDKPEWGEFGFSGYEWDWDETELDNMWKNITHWALLPELPVVGE